MPYELEWNEAKLKLATKQGTIQFSFNTEGLDELVEIFKTIMFWMGYQPDTIDKVFVDE